jgi:hypothetical protein
VALAPPRFDAPTWLTVRRAGAAAVNGAARPVLGLEREAVFEVLADGESARADLRVELRPLAAAPATSDAPPVAFPATVFERSSRGDAVALRARFTPSGVGPGAYRLTVHAGGASAAIDCDLVVALPGATDLAWTRAIEPAARAGVRTAESPGAAPGPARASARWTRARAAAYEAAYAAALSLLAAGDETRARVEVERLEREALEARPGLSGDDLADVEIPVLRAAGAAQPQAWLPVLALYGDLYRDAIAAGRYLHSTHARQTAFTLVEALVRRDQASGPIAARFLSSFAGGMLRAHGAGSLSRRALDRALELDPANVAARLCLVLQLAQRGETRPALAALEPLVAAGHREARARRAVDLLRVGNAREREEAQGDLTELGGGEDWIAALAHQELARHALGANRLGEAEAAARRGLETFPADQKLRLLLAFVEERRRRPDAARALADEIVSQLEGASPRRRFADLPAEDLARDAELFAAAAREARPLLAAGLARRKAR